MTSDMVDNIIAYESDAMTDDEILDFFQDLVSSGVAWSLQGSYGRTAQQLLDAGLIREQ